MRFYVSWYPGDPEYSLYDDECALLVSITSVAQQWSLRNLQRTPKFLMIDSGGYRFATAPQEALSPARILDRQMQLLDGLDIPTIICTRDYPILDRKATTQKKDEYITETIASAYELRNLLVRNGIPSHVKPMAVIQGDTPEALAYCAAELKLLDFPMYGIGSLAGLRNHVPIWERVQAVLRIIAPEQLHVFGVSVIKTIRALRKVGVHSFDSSRPAKAAMFNELLYSNPYRRYGIYEIGRERQRGRIPREQRLVEPLPCACPICQIDPQMVMGVGKRENIRSRTLHNYFHLKKIFSP